MRALMEGGDWPQNPGDDAMLSAVELPPLAVLTASTTLRFATGLRCLRRIEGWFADIA
jgi:hypothetical protein